MKRIDIEFGIGDIVEIRDIARGHVVLHRGYVTAVEINRHGNRFYVLFWNQDQQKGEYFHALELTLAENEVV